MWLRNFTHHYYTVQYLGAVHRPYISLYKLVSVTISKQFIVIWWGTFPCFFCQIHQIFSVPFLFIFLSLFKRWPSFGFLHDVVSKCTDASEECTACIFRVTKLVKVNALVIHWNKCWLHKNCWYLASHNCRRQKVGAGIVLSPWKLWFPRTALFPFSPSLTCRIFGNKLGVGCGPKAAGVKLQWAWLSCGWITTGPVQYSVTLKLEAEHTYETSDYLTTGCCRNPR